MTNEIVLTAMIACLLNRFAAYVETIGFAALSCFAPVVHMQTLSPDLISRIRQVLIAPDADGGARAMVAAWGDDLRYGAVMADDGDPRVVRDLSAGLVSPEMGNR